MPLHPEVDGEFYINNVNDDFWLRESGVWGKKGRMVRAHVVGLTSEGPYPFTNGQYFELAMSETDEHFSPDFSAARSEVVAIYPTAASCDVVLTDNLSAFLGRGSNVICTAAFIGVEQRAVLAFNDVLVRKFTPLWVVMPNVADVALAGIRCLFASEPV